MNKFMEKVFTSMVIIFACLSVFSSCDKENFENELNDANLTTVQTRSNYDTGNVPDIIDQIYDVPVYAILGSNNGHEHRMLAIRQKDDVVELYYRDDGTKREKFLIKKELNGYYNIYPEGGSSKFKKPILSARIEPHLTLCRLIEYVNNYTTPGRFSFIKSSFGNQHYKIVLNTIASGSKLQPDTYGSRTLCFKKDIIYDGTDSWRIVLPDNSEFRRVRYIKEPGDYIDTVITNLKTYTYENIYGEYPLTTSLNIEETLRTTSKFSQNHGISVQYSNSSSVKVGIPDINSDLTFSTNYTTNNSWSLSFENTEEKTVSVKSTHGVTIPAKKNAIITVAMRDYVAQLTYIAEIRCTNTGKILYVKGKWNGKMGDDVFLKLRYADSVTRSKSSREFTTAEGIKGSLDILNH